MSAEATPTSGFSLQQVFVPKQSFEGVVVTSQMPESASQMEMKFSWDWRLLEERQFEVVIALRIHPTQERPESIEVTTIGRFQLEGTAQSVDIETFASKHAPAILLPYAREVISSLTGRGLFGAFYLPPLNIVRMMSGMDAAASSGSRQLKEDPGAVARLGLRAS